MASTAAIKLEPSATTKLEPSAAAKKLESAAAKTKLESAAAKTKLESAAYGRMRKESPSEFVPRSVFLAHGKGSEVDRRNSLWVKAALVYESVTGLHVDDRAAPVATGLLLRVADVCSSRIRDEESKKKHVDLTGEDGGDGGNRKEAGKTTTELPPDEKEWVMDGIFLVAGFLPKLLTTIGRERNDTAAASRDHVDKAFKSTHMEDIVMDVIKLENQLPLGLLLDVVDHVQKAVHDVAGEFAALDLGKYNLGFDRSRFLEDVVGKFCWYYSPFSVKQVPAAAAPPPPRDGRRDDAKMEERTLLDCLHDSVVPRAPEPGAGGGGGKTARMPTARELSRCGVRLAAGEDGRAAVEFDERSSTLRLPALVHDFKLATVARNLRAREYLLEEQSKPVTRYFQMMNELVAEEADARILLRAGVVRASSAVAAAGGPVRAAKEVRELIQAIKGYATYPSVFMAMDVQIDKVRQFRDQRMKKFLVRYRPGVVWASSVAAVSAVAIVAGRRNRA